MGAFLLLTVVDLPWQVRFQTKLCAARYHIAGIQNFPYSCPSVVCLADMNNIRNISFEVKHCITEAVVLSR